MRKNLERVLRQYPHPYVTDIELSNLLEKSPDSRYGKVKRMIAQGQLIHIRRGLYCLTDEIGSFKKPGLFELAHYIYGPSLISLESALSIYNLIPEAVYTVTSVTGRRAKEVETPLGHFSYCHAPLDNLYTAATLFKDNDQRFFIARPWRAICDYVFCHRMQWRGIDPLINSLRIDPDALPELRDAEVQELDDYYRNKRISQFLKGIQHDLRSAQ